MTLPSMLCDCQVATDCNRSHVSFVMVIDEEKTGPPEGGRYNCEESLSMLDARALVRPEGTLLIVLEEGLSSEISVWYYARRFQMLAKLLR